MSNIQPVSAARHGTMRWRRVAGFGFAASQSLAPLSAAEVAKAALSLPLAFVEQNGALALVAVLGFAPDQNLYVAPNGSWIGAYTPATFRAYPFRVGRNEAGELLLCVDEASGLIGETHGGETFFDESGEPSAVVGQIWTFLQETAKGELALTQACSHLAAANVIEPWPITIQNEDGSKNVAGLYRVNERALQNLDDATFGQLRRAGVVTLAYAQLLSMGNLADLAKLAQAQAEAERAKTPSKSMISLPDDNTIDWDWSKIGR